MVRRLHYLYVEADLTLLAQCYWGTLAYQNVHDALFRRHHCLVTAGDKAAQLKVCDSQNAVQHLSVKPYSRGPFMASMFLLVFWILFSGP